MNHIKNKFKAKNVGIISGGSPEERRVAEEISQEIFKSLKKKHVYIPYIISLDKNIERRINQYKIDVAFIVDAIFLDTNKTTNPHLNNQTLREILEKHNIPLLVQIVKQQHEQETKLPLSLLSKKLV